MSFSKYTVIAERPNKTVYRDGDTVVLKKYEPCCVFCGSNKKVTLYKDKCICDNCRRELAL